MDPVPPGREGALLPCFANPHVMTLPQLAKRTAWVELRHLPVRANDISIRHDGNAATVLTNNRGPALVWQAALPGRHAELLVDGRRHAATVLTLPPGREVSLVRVAVAPGVPVRVALAN